jgi:hypothetical protein
MYGYRFSVTYLTSQRLHCKLQTRPLVKRAPYRKWKQAIVTKKRIRIKSGHGPQRGVRYQDELVDWPSAVRYTQLNSIWTYGIQLWGKASTSNIEILQRFLSKALRMIVDTPWYVANTAIRRDLQIPRVKEEIRRYSSQYSARLSAHPNDLIVNLMELPDNRRLRRHLPKDLPTRFLVQLLYL